MLTPSAVAPRGKPYKLADERGMSLLVKPDGHRIRLPGLNRRDAPAYSRRHASFRTGFNPGWVLWNQRRGYLGAVDEYALAAVLQELEAHPRGRRGWLRRKVD